MTELVSRGWQAHKQETVHGELAKTGKHEGPRHDEQRNDCGHKFNTT